MNGELLLSGHYFNITEVWHYLTRTLTSVSSTTPTETLRGWMQILDALSRQIYMNDGGSINDRKKIHICTMKNTYMLIAASSFQMTRNRTWCDNNWHLASHPPQTTYFLCNLAPATKRYVDFCFLTYKLRVLLSCLCTLQACGWEQIK